MAAAAVALVAGFSIALLSNPAAARSDAARQHTTCPKNTAEPLHVCHECRRAIRPSGPSGLRTGSGETNGLAPGHQAVSLGRQIAVRWPAGHAQGHVRATGVMRVGSVLLLN